VARDTTPPTLTLAALVQGDVHVTWSATDPDSGVDASTCLLEVREDEGTWQTFSTECGGDDTHDGQPGHTYTFRLAASDNVSNAASLEVEAVFPYVKKYYYANGQRVAMRQEGVVYYIHSDHLGSTSLTTDQNQQVVARQRYYPYGTPRWSQGTLPTDYTFTGQRDEAGLGLMHYGARFYSPRLGRFVSADSIVPDYDDPQALNRYAYVLNNPVLYTDPSGHCPLSVSQCWTVIEGHQVPIDRDFPGGYYHIPVTPSHGENWGVDLPYDPIWDRPMGVEAAVAMGDSPEQYYQGMATYFSLLLSAMGWASAWSAAERAAWAANEAEALQAADMLDDASGALRAGEAGRFGDLDARTVVGDDLTPHHMPQRALGYTSPEDGGALMMTHAEHAQTRTFLGRGARTAVQDAGKPFRDVLAADIQDVRSIVGSRYNEGLQALIDYYKTDFPHLMAK
jgi:RHS repeat-associated protein